MIEEVDLSKLPPLQTTWHERSRSSLERVMYEVDAWGIETGRTRVDKIYGPPPYVARPEGNELSPLPADPPLTIVRQLVPWWKIIATSTVTVAVIELIVRLAT